MGLMFKQERDANKMVIYVNIHIKIIMAHLTNAVKERPWSHESL